MEKITRNNRSLRCSNIELLRIVAMFLVLMVHADFWSLGAPTVQEIQTSQLNSYPRLFIESLSIVCVDVFVLISGWFGIKASTKSLMNFVFQCLFFFVVIYAACIMFGINTINLHGIAYSLCFGKGNWFIKAYICLYILTPVLNAFVSTASKKQMLLVLLMFFAFQTVYGWTGSAQFIVGGYSTISFIGLYLLGRYLKLYLSNRYSAAPPPIVDIYLLVMRNAYYNYRNTRYAL